MAQKLLERIKRIDELIFLKATGKPEQLARRLHISKSTLYEILKALKDLGAPIAYDAEKGSYVYKEVGRFTIQFNRES
jgi:predicted DNA-binding transcriptional regulator YafY